MNAPEKLRPRLRGRWSYVPVAVVIIAGLILSIKAFTLARQAELGVLQERFIQRAGERIHALEQDLGNNLEATKFIGDLYGSSLFVDRQEFQVFVSRILREHPSLDYLAWVPRVGEERRLSIVSLARSQGLDDFDLREDGPQGALRPAAVRETYYPIYYVEPMAANGNLLGLDLGIRPAYRKALEQARDQARLVATGGVALGRGDMATEGFLAFWPIYAKWRPIDTEAQRRQHLEGFAMAALRLADVVASSRGPSSTTGLDLKLSIFDHSAPDGGRWLYGSGNGAAPPDPPADGVLVESFRLTRRLEVGGRQWLVVCTVESGSLEDTRRLLAPIWLGLLGLVLTLTLAAYILSGIRRSALVEQQVFERTEKLNYRTRALAESNAKLANEVTARREAERSLAVQVEEHALANTELARTLEQLKEAQDQLVQTEKLASLGALVAGVAHEINTPVGVAVTAASTLRARAEALARDLEQGQLKKSSLKDFLETADQSTRILLSNLERAAELIQSFKQVAVDRSNSERRRFNVREYMEEILLSLRPRLKQTPHRVELECDDALEIDSYPGALSQVLTNLIMNSLIHAYDSDDGRSGVMRLQVRRAGEHLELRYSDDGKGMTTEQLRQIFEPFYTTRRGAGGSGLGMHIVYNLVTQTLGGAIQVNSQPGQGVEFTLSLPMQAGD